MTISEQINTNTIKENKKCQAQVRVNGNRFEREIAEFLSKTFDASFLRIPSSRCICSVEKIIYEKPYLMMRKSRVRREISTHQIIGNILMSNANLIGAFPYHQLFTGEVKLLDKWIEQVKETCNTGDLNIIFIKINNQGKWVLYEDANLFTTKISINYKDWIFTSWDDFWNHPSNIDNMKKYATESVDKFPQTI